MAETCAKVDLARKQLALRYSTLILGLGLSQQHHMACGKSVPTHTPLLRPLKIFQLACVAFVNIQLPAWKWQQWLCLSRSKQSWTHRDRHLYEVCAGDRICLCAVSQFIQFLFHIQSGTVVGGFCKICFFFHSFLCLWSDSIFLLLLFYSLLTTAHALVDSAIKHHVMSGRCLSLSVYTAFCATWHGWPSTGRTWEGFRRRWADSCAPTRSTPRWMPGSQRGAKDRRRTRPTLKSLACWRLGRSMTWSQCGHHMVTQRDKPGNWIKSCF